MANYYKYFLLLTLATILLTSCHEGREAGDLWGQWRMDYSDSKYVSFSGSIAWIKDLNMGYVYGNFQHVGDSLFIQCYSEKAEKTDTTLIEESFGFKPFNNIRVKIAALDNDQLVITKDSKTWSFHKY